MARTKLTPEQKEAQRKASELANIESNRQRDINDRLKDVAEGRVSPVRTRMHSIGDKVEYGAFEEVWVKDILANGLVYILGVISSERDKGKFEDQRVAAWHDVFPFRTIEEKKAVPVLNKKFDFGNVFNQPITSLLHRHYYWGVDMNPEYQRGNVWSLEDKVALIDSLFNDIEIGRVVLMKRDYEDERKEAYEIIDGKQRLTALSEFYEDRFQYKGLFFSQMHPFDQNHFENKQLAVIEAPNMSREKVIDYFIRVNTSGRPVNPEHLEKVKSMIKKEE